MPPQLKVSRAEARAKIEARLQLGEKLSAQLDTARDNEPLIAASNEIKKWDDYNKDLIATLFDDRETIVDYADESFLIGQKGSRVHRIIWVKPGRLASLVNRLELAAEPAAHDTNGDSSLRATSAHGMELPDKVTLAWLWHRVPIGFWFSAAGILFAVFAAGALVGQTTFVRELLAGIGHWHAPAGREAVPPALPPVAGTAKAPSP